MEISNSITQMKKDEALLQKLHTHKFTSWLKQQVTILFILYVYLKIIAWEYYHAGD